MSSAESKSKRDENKRPNNHHRESIGVELMIPEILVGCQKSREMSSVDWNCMQSILGRRSPIWNDPSCYKSKQNYRASDFQREQPDWIFRISVLHSVSIRLTVNRRSVLQSIIIHVAKVFRLQVAVHQIIVLKSGASPCGQRLHGQSPKQVPTRRAVSTHE
jgi:hypothetical protein